MTLLCNFFYNILKKEPKMYSYFVHDMKHCHIHYEKNCVTITVNIKYSYELR